jgi:spore maturation protein CgeB
LKILIPGWTAPQSFETACARELRKQGCEVFTLENKANRWWLCGRSWWSLTRAERLAQDMLASLELYITARKLRPDWIFMTKGENIRSEVFTLLRKQIGCRLAIWNVDNPFHANVSSFQSLRHIQKADIYFIWAHYLMAALRSAGARQVEFLPFAFDPESHPDVEIPNEEFKKWASDVCFVGTWDAEREQALRPLAKKGFDLAIYGQGWLKNSPPDSPLRAHIRSDSVWNEDVVKAFKGAKLVLNLLRRHNWQGHNFRTMEVAGIGGGALFTPLTPDQNEILFHGGREIFCFEGSHPSPSQIIKLLSTPEHLRAASKEAKQRVFSEHLLSHRIERILSSLKG